MQDLRKGIWSELNTGKAIDLYRRNLQRAYIDRMGYLMTNEQPEISGRYRQYITRTNVDVNESDIRAVTRAELNALQRSIRSGINRTRDAMTKIHLRDALERIDAILNPKA